MKTLIYQVNLLILVLFGALGAKAQKLPAGVILRVVIIRHGEKPTTGDNLSCQGLNRALALPKVLDSLFASKPDYTYVPCITTGGKKTTSVRMFQTVTPYAVQQNLTVDSKYVETDSAGAADDVRQRRGQVLMVWEHGNIPGLVRKLGYDLPHSYAWPGTDFSSVWILDYQAVDSHGRAKHPVRHTFKESITPSTTCPGQ